MAERNGTAERGQQLRFRFAFRRIAAEARGAGTGDAGVDFQLAEDVPPGVEIVIEIDAASVGLPMNRIAAGKPRDGIAQCARAVRAVETDFDAVRVDARDDHQSAPQQCAAHVDVREVEAAVQREAQLFRKSQQQRRRQPLHAVECTGEQDALPAFAQLECPHRTPQHALPQAAHRQERVLPVQAAEKIRHHPFVRVNPIGKFVKHMTPPFRTVGQMPILPIYMNRRR